MQPLFYCAIISFMNQQLVFNHRQNLFINWCMDHIPFITFLESESGMLDDPFTKQHIAGVFYYKAPAIVSIIIDLIVDCLSDEDSARNEAKCIQYNYIEQI